MFATFTVAKTPLAATTNAWIWRRTAETAVHARGTANSGRFAAGESASTLLSTKGIAGLATTDATRAKIAFMECVTTHD